MAESAHCVCVGVFMCFGMHACACLMHEHVCITCLCVFVCVCVREKIFFSESLFSFWKIFQCVYRCVCVLVHRWQDMVQTKPNKAMSQGYSFPWISHNHSSFLPSASAVNTYNLV